jgi:magnesium chelatase family protein
MSFPAEFILVAALNSCPSGAYADPKRECRCSPVQVQRYRIASNARMSPKLIKC